jgi:hypothetical protein
LLNFPLLNDERKIGLADHYLNDLVEKARCARKVKAVITRPDQQKASQPGRAPWASVSNDA